MNKSLVFTFILFFISVSVIKAQTSVLNNPFGSEIIVKRIGALSSQIKTSGTVYVFQDIIMSKEKNYIEIPENCVLKFEGGIMGNAIIVGDRTRIEANRVRIFDDNVTLSGSWDIREAYPEWFGAMADGVTDETIYVQKALSLKSSFVIVSRGTRFNLRDLVFPQNTYLVYFADSEISIPHGPKRHSGELVIYSANSSYPEQKSGGAVNEIRFEGQIHPAFVADVRKDVHGHDEYLALNQKDNIARVSFQIEDEEIPRASFHYKNNYLKYDLTSGTQIQANRTRIELVGVGTNSWNEPPKQYDFITQKDEDGNLIAGGFVLSQGDDNMTLSWTFGRFVKGKPVYFDKKKSRSQVTQEKRIEEGLASLNTTHHKHGWAVGIPASISDAMFTVGGRIYAVNTDMYSNGFQVSEPGFGFRYYTGLTDLNPRERIMVLDKFNSANRRIYLRNEKNDNLGMVGACSAFTKLFVSRGVLVRAPNSYNIDSVVKENNCRGKYRIVFTTPLQSNTYCVSISTNDPMVYGCVSNESERGFTLELYITGTNKPIDISKGSIMVSCFGGDF